MEVLLDPAIELFGAVDLLGRGKSSSAARPQGAYARALMRACAPFRAHPAVKLNARARKEDPDGFQRKDLLLLRSAPPALAFDETMSSCRGEAERSGDWEPWLAAMRDFAREARFTAALAAAARLVKPQLAALRGRVAKADYVGKLEAYAGLPYHGRYRIIVSPLAAKSRGLNRVRTRDDGLRDIVSVLGGFDESDDGLDALAWHELSHGVLDMTVDLYDHEERDTPLALGPGMSHNCRNWLHGMREHLVRAVMIRLIARERGEKAAASQFESEEFSRRPHLAAFVARLREYEASRRDYPTLADFYPRLREVFPPYGTAKPFARDPDPDAALRKAAGPFYTESQRALAAAHLDLMLERSLDERLVLRRKALSALLTKTRS